jgi:hypothetical protein
MISTSRPAARLKGLLASPACQPVFDFRLNRPAGIAEVAPHFFAHGFARIKDTHTRRDASRSKRQGYEMRRDTREGAVVTGRRFISVGQFLCHLGIST